MIDIPRNSHRLAKEFAPILHFHPQEGSWCCFPSDAEKVYSRYGTNWTFFKQELSPKTFDPNAPCYYEVFSHNGWTQIRYWFWYNYNRFPSGRLGIGAHLGDWEHVEVRIYPKLLDGSVVWLLSNHLSARLGARPANLTLPGFKPENLMVEDWHVHSWVALGSHAHYPSPNSPPFKIARFWRDEITDGGPTWETEYSLKPLNKTNFYHFKGRWGDRKAPRSPTNEYNGPWRNAPNVHPLNISERKSWFF